MKNKLMVINKYEYVKSFETVNKLMPSAWIILQIDGRHFRQFSEQHEFEKPNDEQALNLMNACAKGMLEEFPDIVFSYGFSDEYSFVFRKTTGFYRRRSSKIVSVTVSFFSSFYAKKWKEIFPEKDLKSIPTFDACIFCCPSAEIVRDYLEWRQEVCHVENQYNTCFCELIKSGKTEIEAQTELKGTQTKDIILQLGIKYEDLPAIFLKGSCMFKHKVEEIVKYCEDGQPVKRFRSRLIVDHCDFIDKFWEDRVFFLKDE